MHAVDCKCTLFDFKLFCGITKANREHSFRLYRPLVLLFDCFHLVVVTTVRDHLKPLQFCLISVTNYIPAIYCQQTIRTTAGKCKFRRLTAAYERYSQTATDKIVITMAQQLRTKNRGTFPQSIRFFECPEPLYTVSPKKNM